MEWNIHGMAGYGNYKIPDKIIADAILEHSPDLIVLTEFVQAEGYSKLKLFLEQNGYLAFLNEYKKGENGILIAVRQSEVLEDSLACSDLICQLNGDKPNFLQVDVKLKSSGRQLHLIGVRIRDDKATNKKQFYNLKNHVESLGTEAIILCIGDFNAWGSFIVNKSKWDLKPNNCEIYSPGLYLDPKGVYRNTYLNNKLAEWSYVQPSGDRTPLDHMFVSNNCTCIGCSYNWDFVKEDNGYDNRKDLSVLSNLIGLPDHAIFIAIVEI